MIITSYRAIKSGFNSLNLEIYIALYFVPKLSESCSVTSCVSLLKLCLAKHFGGHQTGLSVLVTLCGLVPI